MVSPIRFLVVALLLAPSLASGLGSSLSEAQARERVEMAVRASLKLPPTHFLRAVRCEDLEDDLFSFQVRIKGKIAKFAYVFRITETGYEVISPDEAVFHSSTDGHRVWYAAVSRDAGEVYGLLGFANAAQEFNRLATDAVLRITDESQAVSYATMYWRSVLGSDYGVVVNDLHDLQRQVDDLVYSYRLTTNSRVSFERWWKGFEASGLKPQFGMHATRTAGGYSLSCTGLKLPNSKVPDLRNLEFSVSPTGMVGPISMRSLYPRSSTRP